MSVEGPEIIATLRCQAWERAKGELLSMLHTFWCGDEASQAKYDALNKKIAAFIEDIEDSGLNE